MNVQTEAKLELYKNKIEELKSVYEENAAMKKQVCVFPSILIQKQLNSMSEQPTTTESTPIENYQSKIYEQELLIKDVCCFVYL